MSFAEPKIAPFDRRKSERALRACRVLGIGVCHDLTTTAQDALLRGEGPAAMGALNLLVQHLGGVRYVDPERAPRLVQAPGGPDRCGRCGRVSDEMMCDWTGEMVCEDCLPGESFGLTQSGRQALASAKKQELP